MGVTGCWPSGPVTEVPAPPAATAPSPPPGAPVGVITGAARGIGAAVARSLSAAGWRLGLVDVCDDDPALAYSLATPDDLDATARTLPGEAVTAVVDVRDQDALDAAVTAVVDRFGRLDAAVSAAGAIAGGPSAWETTEATWSVMLDVNLTGVWRLARAAVPALLAAEPPEPTGRRGRFVAVTSAAAGAGLPRLAAYSAAKHGVNGLVKAMAAELAAASVTVNAVAPGSTSTAMLGPSASVYGLDDPAAFAEHQRIGRLLDPDEVAAAVAWLCSAEASGVTGSVVAVDGAFGGGPMTTWGGPGR